MPTLPKYLTDHNHLIVKQASRILDQQGYNQWPDYNDTIRSMLYLTYYNYVKLEGIIIPSLRSNTTLLDELVCRYLLDLYQYITSNSMLIPSTSRLRPRVGYTPEEEQQFYQQETNNDPSTASKHGDTQINNQREVGSTQRTSDESSTGEETYTSGEDEGTSPPESQLQEE